MSDLIHRAELLYALSTLNDMAEIFAAVNNAPTVDAVEVVRCKNCQKCYYDEEWKAYVAKPGCPLKPIGFGCALIEPDGYCSRGVRREDIQ